MNIMTNPFVVGDYASRNLFCGRERERTVLMQEILAEHNIALIGPWRIEEFAADTYILIP